MTVYLVKPRQHFQQNAIGFGPADPVLIGGLSQLRPVGERHLFHLGEFGVDARELSLPIILGHRKLEVLARRQAHQRRQLGLGRHQIPAQFLEML